ncbi:uncharacterized protein CFAP97D2 [Nematostella vectensis]|uniref:uncharacterized protein CFAP97D2 n=1 Tax=Nematostella vectensis TaxID=45351 RepID=UPI0013905309|nr:uncharacterized protein CFAP97D2 [Nematostella vectensis]
MHRSKMTTTSTAANDLLDKRWQRMTYEKHQKRLKDIKSTIDHQNRLSFNHEEVQLQMRLRRAVAEERRQAIIDRENRKILERLMYIATHQRTPLPGVGEAHRKQKKRKQKDGKRKNDAPKGSISTVKLPPIVKNEKQEEKS